MKAAAAAAAAAATIPAAGQMGRGTGTNGSGPESSSARLSEQERVLTTYCPLLAACPRPGSTGWLQAGLWCQVLCVQIPVLPFTTLRVCKQRANLFTPVSLCVKMI